MPQDTVSELLFREYLLTRRQALLMEVDNIERLLRTSPRTSELRKEARENHLTREKEKHDIIPHK